MGHVYRDKRTGWWIAWFRDASGRRRRLRVARDPREARRTLALLESEAIRDRLLNVRPLKPIRFGEYAKLFLEHIQTQMRAWKRYRTSLNSLTPFFGNVSLTAINPEEIERYKKVRLEQVEPSTINRDLQCLRRMCNLAIAWGYARENPVRFVKFLRESSGRLRYLTREEFDRLIEASPDHLKPLITTAVHTGMRQGEMLALTWNDVDLENGFASINDPKNATPRKAPLNATAREAIEGLRSNTRSIKVFVGVDGHQIAARTVEKQFKRALVAAKIEDFKFHDLRHTCASWLVMAGVEIRKVKEVLGHKDIRTTLRYAHLSPDQIVDAVNKLDEFSRRRVSKAS